jgi:bis(5'-nucleosyl)-tetraphosphatase (symmetrical)
MQLVISRVAYELRRLLDVIAFDSGKDQLWFCGDLVNRGPKSLETLRFVKELGNAAITVLGNHDLHLLAVAKQQKKTKPKDSLNPILSAPDKEELLDWLRFQPLFHYNDDFCLIHAGLPPQWGLKKIIKMAEKAEQVLQSPDYIGFLRKMYGNEPDIWSKDLSGMDEIRFIVNCFTRMRYCEANGRLDFNYKGPLGSQPKNLVPWFEVPNRKSTNLQIIFGHWSALGFYQKNNCFGIDTGCLWGGQLTALKLSKGVKRISIDCPGMRKTN